jgi:hypothetical protein
MNENESVLDKDKDVDASSYNELSDAVADAQADHPSVLVMKTHNEPVLDKDKSNSDVSTSSKCVFNCIFVSELFFFLF